MTIPKNTKDCPIAASWADGPADVLGELTRSFSYTFRVRLFGNESFDFLSRSGEFAETEYAA